MHVTQDDVDVVHSEDFDDDLQQQARSRTASAHHRSEHDCSFDPITAPSIPWKRTLMDPSLTGQVEQAEQAAQSVAGKALDQEADQGQPRRVSSVSYDKYMKVIRRMSNAKCAPPPHGFPCLDCSGLQVRRIVHSFARESRTQRRAGFAPRRHRRMVPQPAGIWQQMCVSQQSRHICACYL